MHCITQGPAVNPDKAFQLQQMDCIYRFAALSVCTASSTSAKHGVRELYSWPSFQKIVDLKGKPYVVMEASL
jgi:hypothetical protein